MKRPTSERVYDVIYEFTDIYHKGNKLPVTRVVTDVVKYMLLNNTPVTLGGTVRWFNFKSVGLGVYEVSLDTSVPSPKCNRMIK